MYHVRERLALQIQKTVVSFETSGQSKHPTKRCISFLPNFLHPYVCHSWNEPRLDNNAYTQKDTILTSWSERVLQVPRETPIKMQLVPSLQDQGTKRRFTSTLVSHPYQELCPNTRSLLSMSSRRCRESIASSRSWITRTVSRASPPMIHPFLPQFPSTGKPLTDSAFPAFRRMRDLDR